MSLPSSRRAGAFPVGRIPRNEAIAHATDLLLLAGLAPVAWRYRFAGMTPRPV